MARRQVSLPADLVERAEVEAARHGLSLPGYVALALRTALDAPPDGLAQEPVPDLLPELTVFVKLAVPSEVVQDEDWWWERARGDWRLSATTRGFGRWLAAAGNDGVVRHLWRVAGWEDVGGRARATARTDVSEERLAEAGLTDVVGRRLPPARNPVHVRGPVPRS